MYDRFTQSKRLAGLVGQVKALAMAVKTQPGRSRYARLRQLLAWGVAAADARLQPPLKPANAPR